MPKRPGQVFRLFVGALALVTVAAAAFFLLSPRQTRDVAVPASDATPEQVVEVYTEALDSHDCETAEALMTDGAKDGAKSWCADVARLTDVNIHEHFRERPRWSGHSPGEEVANVPVTFNLKLRLFHNDGSMEEGATTWGYLLVRGSRDVPWRIFDQGVG